jgi:outer membrane receptor protein involved in Fe transport
MPFSRRSDRLVLALFAVVLGAILTGVSGQAATSRLVTFDIRRETLASALFDVARQGGVDLIISPSVVGSGPPRVLKGRMSVETALARLLEGSALGVRRTPDGAFVVFALLTAVASPQVDEVVALPELLVTGRRSQNSDIQRTENDIQPYKVWGAHDLAMSHAESLDDFLRTRLASNGQVASAAQDPAGQNGSSRSEINLRGLGANQTLVLIDGRRMPGLPSNSNAFLQPDINGVPLAAVERIEVLTATSGGIYGAGAVAGTVNIVLKRDYRGADLAVTYGDTSRFDAPTRRVDGRIGFTPDGGHTDVMVAFSYSQGADLRIGERDYPAKARARRNANDPAAFLLEPPASTAVRVTNSAWLEDPAAFDAPLVLKNAYGGGMLSAGSTFAPVGYRGIDADGGALLLANAGKTDAALASGLINPQASLVTRPEVSSALLSVRRRFGPAVEVYFDGLALRNEGRSFSPNTTFDGGYLSANASANPFTSTIFLAYAVPGQLTERRTRTTTTRATAGLIIDLPAAWKLNADYTVGEAKVRSIRTEHGVDSDYFGALEGFTPEGLPALLPLGDYQTFLKALDAYRRDPTISYTQSNIFRVVSARLAGTVMDLPGGPLTLSLLAEDRREHVPTATLGGSTSLGYLVDLPSNVTQTIRSYYAEARAPLVSRDDGPRLLSGLELQLAARRDAVRSTLPANLEDGTEINNQPVDDRRAVSVYTLGLRVFPARDLMLRSSVASGFLPPAIGQLAYATTPYVTNFDLYTALGGEAAGYRFLPPFVVPRDALRGGAPIGIEQAFGVTVGGSRAPERARSVSVGLVATPSVLPGLRASIDYTRIVKTGEPVLIHDGSVQYFLGHEDLYPSRVIRAPLTDADRAKGYTAGVITGINATSLSVGETISQAVDFQVDYLVGVGRTGDLRFSSSATWQPTLKRRTDLEAPVVNLVDAPLGPLTWRGTGGVEWSQGPWMLGVTAEYYGHYRVTPKDAPVEQVVRFQGSPWIPSQVYIHLASAYRFDLPASATVRSLEVRFGVQNLFDHDAPVIADAQSIAYSPYADPRGRRFDLTLLSRF